MSKIPDHLGLARVGLRQSLGERLGCGQRILAAIAMGGQVLDDLDVAADKEQAAGVGPDQGRAGRGLVFVLVLVVFLGLFLRRAG